MNILMNFRQIVKTFIPSKKLSIFVLIVASLGIISGAIFLVMINQNDKSVVINELNGFLSNINSNSINNVQALKNSLFNNYVYIVLIFILGLSLIGTLVNLFFTYIKGFILGFSISSLIYTYGVKGILASVIYIVPVIVNLFLIVLITSYTLVMAKYLYTLILGNRNTGFKMFLKKYFIIFIVVSVVTIFTSLMESFLTPALFKLVVKLFV